MTHKSTSPFKGKVLLTGGSGFIASHVLDALLDYGFQVVVTARSEEKGRRIVESIRGNSADAVSYVVVEDVAREGAFDEAVQSSPPFNYVVHTASPYLLNVQDPVKDILDPAIKGTTNLFSAIQTHAPSVTRVVLTSSSAAILNPDSHARIYDESHWAPVPSDKAMWSGKGDAAYRASKVLSERAAWAFVADQQYQNGKKGFDLVTINCTYTFGPLPRHLSPSETINLSNQRIHAMITGAMRSGLQPTAPVFTFVDVRDVATAHLRALTVPAAGGSRFYVVGGHFSNKRIADVIRAEFPELAERLPPAEKAVDDLPLDAYGFDNGRSRRVLGLRYRGLRECVRDTVLSMLARGEAEWDERLVNSI